VEAQRVTDDLLPARELALDVGSFVMALSRSLTLRSRLVK
jgi:hypothetical protein